jgi:hypothetical protein
MSAPSIAGALIRRVGRPSKVTAGSDLSASARRTGQPSNERAIDRYQEAFEDGELKPTRFEERIVVLDTRLGALRDQDHVLAQDLAVWFARRTLQWAKLGCAQTMR